MATQHPLLILEVTLQGVSKPVVARTLQVPGTFDFYRLHLLINTAMGWEGTHLHEFSSPEHPNMAIGSTDIEDWEEREIRDHHTTLVLDYLHKAGDHLNYLYDFGDGWEHDIKVKTVIQVPKAACVPKLLGASGACPPEDCGGVHGFARFKKVMANPKHPEYKENLAWLGMRPTDKFNPWDADLITHYTLVAALTNKRLAKDLRYLSGE